MINKVYIYFLGLFLLLYSIDLHGNILISGAAEVCSASSTDYVISGYSGYGFQWNVVGGTIDEGQGTRKLSISWLQNSFGRISVLARDSFSANVLYDTIYINVDTSCVWPGDANHDHKVSYTDFLVIGEAYGRTHTSCLDTSSLWKAQARCIWSDTVGLGIEMKHADCNGDGIVNLDDTNAIIRNYSHIAKKKAEIALCPIPEVGDPELRIYTGVDTIYPGMEIFPSVYFGSSIQQVADAYGIAFCITYDPEIFVADSIKCDLTMQWLTSGCKYPIIFCKNFPDEGRIDFAFSRTDHSFNNDGGELVNMKFKVKDKIPFGKTISRFTLGEFQFISLEGALMPVIRTNDSSVIANVSGIEQHQLSSPQVYIYPNPAKGKIRVNCSSVIKRIIIFDEMGKYHFDNIFKGNLQREDINLPENMHGIYFLEVVNNEGYISRKKIIVY